jgi:hypothetical protein
VKQLDRLDFRSDGPARRTHNSAADDMSDLYDTDRTEGEAARHWKPA